MPTITPNNQTVLHGQKNDCCCVSALFVSVVTWSGTTMLSRRTLICVPIVLFFAANFRDARGDEPFLNALRITSFAGDSGDSAFTPVFVSSQERLTLSQENRLQNGSLIEGHDDFNNTGYGVSSAEDGSVEPVGFTTDAICGEQDCELCGDCEIPLVRHRNGFLQGVQVNYSSIGDDPATGIVVRTVDTSASFAIPLGSMDNLVSITPYFRADLLEAAAIFDVPDSLYETGVKVFWRRPISERLGSMILITPSVRSDFQTSDNAFRLFGLGLLTWQWVPKTLSVSGGAVFTGREDFPVLPAMGLLWTPSPRWRYDIQFPTPKISYRLAKSGCDHETWGYLGGVFGGNTWAVKRTGGVSDELTLSDLRLVFGLEHLQPQNRSVFVEAGYVFNRSIEYTDTAFQQDLDAAMMLRMGVSF
jgi:hypothetical protein